MIVPKLPSIVRNNMHMTLVNLCADDLLLIYLHLKLELLTQFPASTDGKILIFMKKDTSLIESIV